MISRARNSPRKRYPLQRKLHHTDFHRLSISSPSKRNQINGGYDHDKNLDEEELEEELEEEELEDEELEDDIVPQLTHLSLLPKAIPKKKKSNSKSSDIVTLPGTKVRLCTKQSGHRALWWAKGHWVEVQKKGVWKQQWMCAVKLEDGTECGKLEPVSNSRAQDHLRKQHDIETSTKALLALGNQNPNVQTEETADTNAFLINPLRLKEKVIYWFACCHIPFQKVEHDSFKELLEELNPSALDFIPSADTVKNWVMDEFKNRKKELGEALVTCKAKIHLAYDGWTSPNGHGLQTIVGHWIDDELTFHSALLGMREPDGRHTGETLGSCLEQLILELGIPDDQLGYHMLDNASNNDTTVRYFLHDDDYETKRLRCLGHILHLIVMAFIHAFDKPPPGQEQKSLMKRVRWLINWITNSVIFTKFWHEIPGVSALLPDCDTRWSSTDEMIESMLKNKKALNKFVSAAAKDTANKPDLRTKIKDATLNDADWEQLQYLYDALSPFRAAITCMQGISRYLYRGVNM